MNDSGAALKWIAGLIAATLFLCAFLILKTDPVRNEGQVRTAAINQVKDFAKFMVTRPEIAQPKQRSVISMLSHRIEEKPLVSEEFSTEMKRRLLEIKSDPLENNQQFKSFLLEHEEEAIFYFKAEFSRPKSEHNQEWSNEMETVLFLARTSEFKLQTKEAALDLFSRQLLDARADPLVQNQKRTDAWFEDYLRAETRTAYKNAIFSAYQLKVNQSSSAQSE